MIALDSNIWIAQLNPNDTNHTNAKKIFARIDEPIIVPEYVAIEVATVVMMKIGKNIANQFLKTVTTSSRHIFLRSDEYLFQETSEVFVARKSRTLSFVDCALLVVARVYPVLTFDKKLKKALSLIR